MAKSNEVLAKAALYTEVYKDHNRKYWNGVVGMIPLYLDGKKSLVEGYCVDIGVVSGDFAATSMTLKSADLPHVEPTSQTTSSADDDVVSGAPTGAGRGSGSATGRVPGATRGGVAGVAPASETAPQAPTAALLPELMAPADVDRIAYILDRYPLLSYGSGETKLRGAGIQTAIWRLLYADTPLYTVYPNISPTMADMPVHDNDPQRTDLDIENLGRKCCGIRRQTSVGAEGGELTVLLNSTRRSSRSCLRLAQQALSGRGPTVPTHHQQRNLCGGTSSTR